MRRYFVVVASLALLTLGQDDCLQDLDGDGYPGIEDCDDNNPEIYPEAPELCNGLDDDCDRAVDEDFDLDLDGYSTCDLENNPADCDDNYPGTYPGALELCDGLDNNCDGLIDEDYDLDNDGFSICGGDCNDENPFINPDAREYCDGVDNNCDGWIDEGFDEDQDGVTRCDGDCDDNDPTSYPGALDPCDGVDNDCNGEIDEAFDNDGDGVTTCGGDCNDSNPSIFEGNEEVCDGLDNNCDTLIDEGVLTIWYLDADEDGFGNPITAVEACSAPSEVYIVKAGDCNDLDPGINPNAVETCDGVDEDCDGVVDNGFDRDRDGVTSCAGDCDDNDWTIYPGAPEICDGIDSDCGGEVEDRCPAPVASLEFAVAGEGSGTVVAVAYGLDPLDVFLDADASYDPDGGEVTWDWDLGDGTTVNGVPIVEHTYRAEAPDGVTTYAVTLTVTDDEGDIATKQIAVKVCGLDYPEECSASSQR